METAAAWADAVSRRDAPTLIIATRQKLPEIPRPQGFDTGDLLRGGYVAAEASRAPELLLIATGSDPFVIPVPGGLREDAFVLATLQDHHAGVHVESASVLDAEEGLIVIRLNQALAEPARVGWIVLG